MFSVQILYFSHRLGRLSILMECFEAKFNTFQIFWVEIRYFSNVLDPRHIVFNVFVYKYEFLKFLCTKLDSILLNVLKQKKIFFKYSGQNFHTFRIILGQNQILFTLFGYTNQILFECSSQKQIFPNVLLKTECFGVRIKYFSNVLNRICILFQCFGQNSILFKCFIANSDYFQLFWKEN